jgi:glutathione synthase/RimK-type ligase-like ATP-grasp enzyme
MRAVILVPAPDFPEDWDWAYEVEAAALLGAGFSVEARPWSDPGELVGFDLVTPLVAWGYHQDSTRWHALLDRLEREAIPTLNPVPLLRWNSDKRYLAELGAKGIATIPTRVVAALDEAALHGARSEFGDELVIKPPVSASADGTYRLAAGDPIPQASRGKAMMVQPFLRSVAEEGEYSVMLFGGKFSHSIVKRPKAGDYRVQPHLGGTEQPCTVPEGAIELAHAALAAAPADAAYARVDMVRDNKGRLAIIELELIEPALWLQHAPDGGASFASAIRAALPQKQPLADR